MVEMRTAVSHGLGCVPGERHAPAGPKTSISIKLAPIVAPGWGGARANTGGARANAGGARPNTGGARPNCGGPQPGSGRPRHGEPEIPVRAIQVRPYGPRWHVFQVLAGTEDEVVKALCKGEVREGKPPRPLYEALHLLTRTVRLRHGVRVPLDVPMLPGYGLIRFDAAVDNWKPIIRCDGVLRLFMTESGRPLPLRDSNVEALVKQSRQDRPAKAQGMPARKPGDQLRVADGPFTSFAAVCTACDGITTTADVQIFGRSTAVTLLYTAFEAC